MSNQYTIEDIRHLCETHEWSSLEGLEGGEIEVSAHEDSDAFGVFTPIGWKVKDAYKFRLYKIEEAK
jgi:hypothetical protein